MLLVSSMMNIAVWGHEEICADFQENNKHLSHCFRYPAHPTMIHNHSLECKSALIGMISLESCDSGICKFNEWLLHMGLAKLFDLTLNLAALVLAALDYGRYVYGSKLQLLRADGNNFYRTIGYAKLGLIIMAAVICMAIPLYFGSQFLPVGEELIDMGCLRHASPTAGAIGIHMAECICIQMSLQDLAFVIQDLAYRYYKANQGQRYMRLPTRIEPSNDFIIRRSQAHAMQLWLYLVGTMWGLLWSGFELYWWAGNIEDVRSLDESATTKNVGDWCFYCPGAQSMMSGDRLGAHVAVHYIAWFLIILTAMTAVSILVLTLWAARCEF